jgi:hypothetical protein
MKHVAHLIRADMRQFRWPLAVWLLLVVLDAGMAAFRPSLGADDELYANSAIVTGLLWWALQIGTLLLVPMIVQSHPAVGTDAFWMTRPVHPLAIFVSKIVLLGVTTVLLYCAARLVLMVWVGVLAREALLVSLDTAIRSAAWLALLMAGAVVTVNLPRFALLCGAAIAALVLVFAVLIMQARTKDSDTTEAVFVASTPASLPPADDPTPQLLFMLSLTAAGFSLAGLQYRSRLRRVSVPAAAGGLVLAALAIPYWPIPLLKVRSETPAWTERADALRLRAASSTIEIAQPPGYFGAETAPRTGTLPVSIGGLEPGWVPRLELLGTSLARDDGTTLVSRQRGYQSEARTEGSAEPVWHAVARQVLSVEQVYGMPASPFDATVAIVLKAQQVGTGNMRGRYRGDFAVHLARWDVIAALPLKPGAVVTDDSYRFAIEQVAAGPGVALTLRGREWRATSTFDRKPHITYSFYVRNTSHSRALEGSISAPFDEMANLSLGLPFTISSHGAPSFFLRSAFAVFPTYPAQADRKIDWDPAWYADAELVVVRVTEQAAVRRTLDIPDATLVVQK